MTSGIGAPSFDVAGAIGLFKMLEYVGLAVIYGSLAVTFRSTRPREGSVDALG